MREARSFKMAYNRRITAFLIMVVVSSFVNSVSSSPAWPSFTKRNVQALARDGLLSTRISNANDYKRSISTLAKNGQLPKLTTSEENSEEEDNENESLKRNIEAMARLGNLGSYDSKRNTGTLARNGVKAGKRFSDDKRNIGSLARNGYLKNDQDINKRENSIEDEYYFPFYQNPVSPVEDFPLDYSEMLELPENGNDIISPSDDFKRNIATLLRQNAYNMMANNPKYRPMTTKHESDNYLNKLDKRQSIGMPNHGLYRTITPASQIKRYIISFPERSGVPTMQEYDEIPEQTEKRSVGSIPLTRMSELGNISLIPKVSQQPIQTTPTYRRRQYLLTRTRPLGGEVDQ